jgi:triphosphoribosyl-dephospho-CoA synthetase
MYQPVDEAGESVAEFVDSSTDVNSGIITDGTPHAFFLNMLNRELGNILRGNEKTDDSRLLKAVIRIIDARISMVSEKSVAMK